MHKYYTHGGGIHTHKLNKLNSSLATYCYATFGSHLVEDEINNFPLLVSMNEKNAIIGRQILPKLKSTGAYTFSKV